MANKTFRSASIYVKSKKIAEITSSTYEVMSGDEQQIGTEGVLGFSDGVATSKLDFDTVCPVTGHELALKTILKGKQTVTAAVLVDGGLETFDCRIMTRSYTSDAKTGECKGKFSLIGNDPVIA
jgi:hypothetical protein